MSQSPVATNLAPMVPKGEHPPATSGEGQQSSLETLVEVLGPDWAEGTGPLYEKLASALRRAVEHGFLAADTRLPSERGVAEALFVSRSTIVAAYDVLRDEGLLSSRRGSGTWLRGRLPGTFGDDQAFTAVAQDAYLSNFIDSPPSAINLTVPMPTAALESVFSDAMPGRFGAEVLREATVIGYQPRGLPSLRRRIARYLELGGLPTSPDDVLVTGGAQQAVSLILSLFVRPNEELIVENPTYRGLVDALLLSRARAIPLNIEDVDLPSRISALASQHAPRLIFMTPTCQFPTGITVDEDSRREIVRVAKKASIPIIEDTVLADLSLDRPPAHLAAYASGSTPVILIGSASKVLWGGFRVGWIRAPAPVISRLVRLKAISDMGTSAIAQVVVRDLLENIDSILELQRAEVRSSLDLMETALRTSLPDWRWRRPKGGRSLWVQLPHGNAKNFAEFALLNGVAVSSGTTLSHDGGFEDFIRLPFVYPPRIISEACHRLQDAWTSYAATLST
jgi:DNA-binding transcriptional MocR family regulator